MARAPAIEVDVLVIGAGFSGLVAASSLVRQGVECAILEASNRVGGRSKPGYLMGDPIDLGAQWITPGQSQVYELVQSYGLETTPQYATGNWRLRHNRSTKDHISGKSPLSFLASQDLRASLRKLDRLAQTLSINQFWTKPIAKKWDAFSVEAWKRTNLQTREARHYFDMLVRSSMCAEASEISFLHFLGVVQSVGGVQDLLLGQEGFQREVVLGGLHQIAAKMAGELKEHIHLSVPVHAIDQSKDGVTVYGGKKTYRARRVIVAMPPAMAGRLVYNPSLPARRDALTQRFPMGSVIKCFIGYDRPFWRTDGYSGHMIDLDSYVSFAFDATPPQAEYGVLVAFFVGDAARQWSEKKMEDRRQIVVNRLSKVFGEEAEHPMDYVDCDWAAEDWSRGGFSGYMPPGVATTLGDVMRQPCGNIHWACAEISESWIGHVEGAIRSGQRAAQEVLDWIKADDGIDIGTIEVHPNARSSEAIPEPSQAESELARQATS